MNRADPLSVYGDDSSSGNGHTEGEDPLSRRSSRGLSFLNGQATLPTLVNEALTPPSSASAKRASSEYLIMLPANNKTPLGSTYSNAYAGVAVQQTDSLSADARASAAGYQLATATAVMPALSDSTQETMLVVVEEDGV